MVFLILPCFTGMSVVLGSWILVIFFFPYNPTSPHPDNPRNRPTPESLISVHFGSVSVRFGSASGPFENFRARFGVLGGVGVASGRWGFCKGKKYH